MTPLTFFFFFRLLPLVVATADHLPPSCPIHCLLYFHTNHLHVHLHYIHKPSLRSTSSPSTRQLHLQHSLPNISTIPPQHMSKPFQPGLSGFISKLLHLHCPSDLLISNFVHPCHSQRKSQHLHLRHLQLSLLSFRQSHSLQTIHHSRTHYCLVNLPFHSCCCPSVTHQP
ncbi:hypothetical protein SRHO_G00177330 [Serrasalmus rhombeus]